MTRNILWGAGLLMILTLYGCGGGDTSPSSVADAVAKRASSQNGTYVLMVNNDLGIHCTCPDSSLVSILPPANTLRAQVLYNRPGEDPQIITDPNLIKIEYTVPFADQLMQDPQYLTYIDNANKLYPTQEGWAKVGRNNVNGISGSPLKTGTFTAKPEHNMWVAELIPVFPPKQPSGGEGTFKDAFGDTRQAFPRVTVTVRDAKTGAILAQNTNVTTPVAFANCCTCHREIYKDKFGSYPANPLDSFRETMLKPHDAQHGTQLLKLTQAGVPVRCSRCHIDPAVGGKTPGYPVSIYPQAKGLKLPVPNKMTLSLALHQFHNSQSEFHSRFAALGFKESCEACHPGKETVGCLRGVHVNTTPQGTKLDFKCSDCHGDLNTRFTSGQLADPWSFRTLPRCDQCHSNTGEWTTAQISSYNNIQFGGAFLNSRGHAGQKLLCTSCHGAPHAEAPSKISWENTFFSDFNGGKVAPLGKCYGCHTSEGTSGWGVPPHAGSKLPSSGGTGTTTPPSGSGTGATLYAQYCQGCHGALATSSKLGRTAAQISGAISANSGGMGSLSSLTATQISDIAAALSSSTPTPGTTDGATLYGSYCAGCHGALASSAKGGATVSRIQTAITNNTGGMGSLSTLTSTQLSAIAAALATVTPSPTSTPACGSCHAIPPATGKHSTHRSEGVSCATCHGTGYSTTAVNTATHNNGVYNVAATIGWNALTRSCSNSCHGTHTWSSAPTPVTTTTSSTSTPSATDGAAQYAANCASCHGPIVQFPGTWTLSLGYQRGNP